MAIRIAAVDDELPKIIQRLHTVQISHRPAREVIENWDNPNTLFYCDPPFLHSTRASTKVYGVETTDKDQKDLAKTLRACQGKGPGVGRSL